MREMKIIKSGARRASEAPAADGSRAAQGHKRGALDTCMCVPVPLSGCFVQGGCGSAAELAVKGSVTCEKKKKKTHSLSVFLSNSIYSSLFTLCICLARAFRPVSAMVHTKQVELRLKYCQQSRRERPLTDTASSMAAYTLKWHYSLSFSPSPPLCFFFPLHFFTNQTSEFPGNKIGHWVGGWLYFILNDTSFTRALPMISAR